MQEICKELEVHSLSDLSGCYDNFNSTWYGVHSMEKKVQIYMEQ